MSPSSCALLRLFIAKLTSLKQTKGPSLEQIAVLFDGKDATVAGTNATTKKILDEDSKYDEIEVSQVEHAGHYRGGSV